ncbi:Acg family FMN-binding oxidoreductase [Streptomyces caniscabiei]|uniref:Acg family FMN-binding oxidoreductase n=1 Tax=Streptomyces caniscabiei TaxID=2746961 RepID=UPI000A3763A0|nr:nitroreductase family protein [Streptomyces caniscabiei]MDX3727275.1 nitroreductase family protein [Streptomyces caniscabiei]
MITRELDTRTVTDLVADATAAPSMHNAQPWRFRFLAEERILLLRADLGRAMRRTDPDHRALHIGCGAALFNLRVAAAHAGLSPLVRLLPDPGDPQVLAAVHVTAAHEAAAHAADHGGPTPPERDLARLYPAIRRRHTSRYPFDDRDVPEDVRSRLRAAAAEEEAELSFPGAWHLDTVLELVRDAESRDTLDAGGREDLERWTRLGPEADIAVDGVPEYAFGPRRREGRAPRRDFAGRRPVADRGTTAFETSPHLALLYTRGDTALDWLRAGQALEHVLLEATTAGLASSLTSHPLENADLRTLARDPVSGRGHVQMVLRLGYGPNGPTTPRRPVRDVLDIV